jgi:PhnB protein
MSYTATLSSPVAVSLRVADVRKAAAFYQQIGFRYVMAVPDESDNWLLCLLRFGNGSILLGARDNPRFPRATQRRRNATAAHEPGARLSLDVPNVSTTYAACLGAGCRITAGLSEGIWGRRSFSFVDPFGHEWELTEAVEQPAGRFDREGYDDRMALACQCATIAALVQ